MKRKVTDLEQKLINDGWCLTTKRYTGKHSEKIECYEYHKLSDLRNNGKTFEQVIKLDQKRSQIVDFGIKNIYLHYLNEQELVLIRFLFLELRHYVERLEENHDHSKDIFEYSQINVPNSELDERQELPPMTPEQFDEMCQEMENENAKGS